MLEFFNRVADSTAVLAAVALAVAAYLVFVTFVFRICNRLSRRRRPLQGWNPPDQKGSHEL